MTKIPGLYDEIDHKRTPPINLRKLIAENPGLPSTMLQSMEENYDDAARMLRLATDRYREHNNGENFIDDDGDRRHDKREVIYGRRCITPTGLQISYDRMRAAAEVRHWKEYLNWASAVEHGRPYEKP